MSSGKRVLKLKLNKGDYTVANAKDINTGALKVLLVGDAGTRKTFLACQFPGCHVVDLDGGMLTVRGQDVTYITIGERPTTDPDFLEIVGGEKSKKHTHSMFLKSQYLIEHWANTLDASHTLVVDSLTFYSEAALNHIRKIENNKDERQNYLGAQKLISGTFEKLKMLPCNVVVTAHRTLIEDDGGGLSQYVPRTAGRGFAMMLPAYFDEIWRTSVKSKKVKGESVQVFTLETIKSAREQGKTRLNLPPVIEEPTYDKILKLTA